MRNPRFVKSSLAAAALGLGMFALPAQATIVVNNTGANPVCAPGDVTLGASAADYCAGYFGDLGNANPATETTRLNDVTDGGDWSFVYKVQDGNPEGSGLFGGIRLTLVDVDVGDVSGEWTIQWEDTNGTDSFNLPLTLDIAAGFKAGSGNSGAGIAYFLFDDFLLTDDPYASSGTFSLTVGKGLSHESLLVRYEEDGGTPPLNIPEPGMLFLLGAGLVGLGLARRKPKY